MNHRHTVSRKGKAVAGALAAGGVAVAVAALVPSAAQASLPVAGHGAAAKTAPRPAARFAPYVDATLTPPFDLPAVSKATGVKQFNLAFIQRGGGCIPEWGGSSGLDANPVAAKIEELRRAGGDVRVSFGGATGAELATACSDPTQLAAAYQKVISAYHLTKVDFDIEGFGLHMPQVNTLRSKALAQLQKDNPRLDVTFTLPVLPNGLTPDGVKTLADAKANGVRISAVNLMAMDYGPSFTGNMARYAMDAASAAHGQIQRTLSLSDADAWKALTITPMIGVNDIKGEVFTLQDAKKLVAFAKSKHLGGFSLWSATRDKQCAGGTKDQADPTCSGVEQSDHAFTKVFASYQG
ncbi:chitinase [Streptomyces sp. NPDC059649]|uniref:chitinase n=1 Tax=Streptomyces sp. NPDC059649 TaxID=3346895 RepID=UPI003678082F